MNDFDFEFLTKSSYGEYHSFSSLQSLPIKLSTDSPPPSTIETKRSGSDNDLVSIVHTSNKTSSNLPCEKASIFQRYQSIIYEHPEQIDSLCRSCTEDLFNAAQSTYRHLQHDGEAYSRAQLLLDENVQPPKIDKSDNSKLVKLVELELECERLDDINKFLQNQLCHLNDLTIGLENNNQTLYTKLNDVMCELSKVDESIQVLTTSSKLAVEEVTLLLNPRSSLLYNLSFSSTADNVVGVLTINGLRISYTPIAACNLNWSEINAGWGCLCQALISYHCENELFFKGKESLYSLIALRRRGIVINSLNKCEKYYLQGTTTSLDDRDIFELNSDYNKAVIGLASIVINYAHVVGKAALLCGSLSKFNFEMYGTYVNTTTPLTVVNLINFFQQMNPNPYLIATETLHSIYNLLVS